MSGRKLNCISLKTPRSDLLQIHKRLSTHSSVLAWRIPGTGQPSALPSMGSHRVGHDWSDLAAAAAARGSLSLLFFPELSTTLGNLVKTWVGSNSYSHQLAFSVTENVKSGTCFPRLICKEGWLEKSADAGGKFLGFFFFLLIRGEGIPRWHSGKESTCQSKFNPWVEKIPWLGNGNPLQCCLENSMDRGIWWATVYGVAKSLTRLSTHTGTNTWKDRKTEESFLSEFPLAASYFWMRL